MRAIANKKTEIQQLAGQPITTQQAYQIIRLALAGQELPEVQSMMYADLAKLCIDSPPQGGFTVDEMRKRLKIAERLDTANARIELEDAEFDKLRELIGQYRWGLMHPDVIAFVDAIEGAKTVSVEKEKQDV